MTAISAAPAGSVRVGTLFAFTSMSCVQLGLAASVGLAAQLGPFGIGWLRLAWAGVILLLIARPWRFRFTRQTFLTCVLLGVATAGMTLLFMASAVRIPLGMASALEFLGPLGVTVARGRGRSRLWALVAAVGVLALTEPWHGGNDVVGILLALGAAVCWAAYILLTQRAGDEVHGLNALAISMPTAAVVATFTLTPGVVQALDLPLILTGLALAVLLPVIPFSLELLALRRLTTAAFGTLMSLEPAISLVIGMIFLGQVPRPLAVLGVALVILAGIGATRSGSRSQSGGVDHDALD